MLRFHRSLAETVGQSVLFLPVEKWLLSCYNVFEQDLRQKTVKNRVDMQNVCLYN